MKKRFKGKYPIDVTSEAVRDLFAAHKHLKQSNGDNDHIDPSMERVSPDVVQKVLSPIMADLNEWYSTLVTSRMGNLKGAAK